MLFYNEMKKINVQAENIYTTLANVLFFKKLGIVQSDELGNLTEKQLEAGVGAAMVYRNSINYYLRQYQELVDSEDTCDECAKSTIFLETKLLSQSLDSLLDSDCGFYMKLKKDN